MSLFSFHRLHFYHHCNALSLLAAFPSFTLSLPPRLSRPKLCGSGAWWQLLPGSAEDTCASKERQRQKRQMGGATEIHSIR